MSEETVVETSAKLIIKSKFENGPTGEETWYVYLGDVELGNITDPLVQKALNSVDKNIEFAIYDLYNFSPRFKECIRILTEKGFNIPRALRGI